MAPFTLLVAALVAPLVFAIPKPGNVYGSGGSAPSGWDAEVENFCTTPEVLVCCNGTTIAGVAGEPTSTQTGCKSSPSPKLPRVRRRLTTLAHSGIDAMAGGQVTYEFGYCPYDFNPYCCAVAVSPACPC